MSLFDSYENLLDEYMENFVVVNKIIAADAYGGTKPTYIDGAVIRAALPYDNSIENKIAQAQGVTNIYTITVKKDVNLDYHTILRRESNGMILRITTNGDDNQTPDSAGINIRQYTAEQYTLPID